MSNFGEYLCRQNQLPKHHKGKRGRNLSETDFKHWALVSSKVHKPSWQAFWPPRTRNYPFGCGQKVPQTIGARIYPHPPKKKKKTGNAHMDATHFKRGFPIPKVKSFNECMMKKCQLSSPWLLDLGSKNVKLSEMIKGPLELLETQSICKHKGWNIWACQALTSRPFNWAPIH